MKWSLSQKIKFAQGFTRPAPRDFVGQGPLTAPEAIAVYNFTLLHNFRYFVSSIFTTFQLEIYML